jgi:hypothetical protein
VVGVGVGDAVEVGSGHTWAQGIVCVGEGGGVGVGDAGQTVEVGGDALHCA